MIVLMNSSKTMDFENKAGISRHTRPEFLKEARKLADRLRRLSPGELARLMSISEKLAQLTAERYAGWKTPFDRHNAKQAILAFRGDVFADIQIDTYAAADYAFAQRHLRILSGLYGILRPLDLMQPYRLEMACKLGLEQANNLYVYWQDKVTGSLQRLIRKNLSTVLVNLASAEYLRVVKTKDLNVQVVTPVFREKKGGQYKFVTVYAKRARGNMCDFIIQKKIDRVEDIKGFKRNGYRYLKKLSSANQWVFGRG